MEEKKDKSKEMANIAVEGAAAEVIQRYGSAIKEYSVAYTGKDNEIAKELKKGLKSISKGKINPGYTSQNIKQQAGFAAEVLDVADTNADNIIKGSLNRKTRTDDLFLTKDPVSGKNIGGVNDELFDHAELNSSGNVIRGTAAQMKFVGKDANSCFNKLMSKKYQKYHDAKAKNEVPSDYYDDVLKAANKKLEKLKKSLNNKTVQENPDLQESIKEQIEKCKKIKRNLRKSSVSNKDAINARLHPKLTTGKRVVTLANDAGIKQMGYGAAIAGSVSLIRNLVSVIKGEEKPEEAAKPVVFDSVTGSVASYTTAFSGATIKGVMQNSSSSYLRALSKTNIAATLVTSVTATTKTLKKFISGKITGLECLEELGETGTTQIASAMFATIGTYAAKEIAGKGAAFAIGQITIPVVGGIVGSMVGYALSSACYNIVVSSLEEAKLAKEERIHIETACAESIKMIREYKSQLQVLIAKYLTENITVFNEGFAKMEKSIGTDDIDGFIAGNLVIQNQLCYKSQFSDFNGFDSLMNNDNESFKL